MSAALRLALKGILASIHQLSGAALALLNDEDEGAQVLEKVRGLPPMFGEPNEENTDGRD